MLCVEVDEKQHKSYSGNDEEDRYNDLFMAFSGKWVFIRFNPDSYVNERGRRVNPELKNRFSELLEEIEKQVNRIEQDENVELVEIIKLYFDNK